MLCTNHLTWEIALFGSDVWWVLQKQSRWSLIVTCSWISVRLVLADTHWVEFPPHRPLNWVWCGWNHFPCWFSVKDKARVGISIYRLVFVIGQINTNPIIAPQPSKPISNGDPTMILLQFPEYFPLWKKLGLRLQFVPFWCILNDAVGGGEGGWWRGFVLLAVTWKEHRERQSRVQTSYFYLYTTHTFPISVS